MMELICGACHGRMLAEAPGSTVACPHCGTLLQTPGEAAPGAPEPLFSVPDDGPAAGPDPAIDTVRLDAWDLFGSGSPAAPAAETFQEHAASDAPSGAFAGFSTSASSVDLDVASPQLVPVIRVSETGSVVVAAAEPASPPADVHVESQPEPPAAPVGIEVGTAADNAAQQAPEATAVPAFPIIEAGQVDSASEPPAPTTDFPPDGAAVTSETRPVIEREAEAVGSA
ncbi:MAG: hypothetical protein ACM3U2_09755, partial [Deltaproteobacteria bacterium]